MVKQFFKKMILEILSWCAKQLSLKKPHVNVYNIYFKSWFELNVT